MKLIFAFVTAWMLFATTSDISMLHVRIGDPESVLKKIKLDIEAEESGMIKFRTSDGNDFSVTSENGKVVYMENDWLQNPKSAKPLISKFTFGQTSLKDIRKTFGTNGFAFVSRSAFKTKTDLIQFNCFEF